MNLDSEAYWLQRISELDDRIVKLQHEKEDLKTEIHSLRNELVKRNATIQDQANRLVEFQKKEVRRDTYELND